MRAVRKRVTGGSLLAMRTHGGCAAACIGWRQRSLDEDARRVRGSAQKFANRLQIAQIHPYHRPHGDAHWHCWEPSRHVPSSQNHFCILYFFWSWLFLSAQLLLSVLCACLLYIRYFLREHLCWCTRYLYAFNFTFSSLTFSKARFL